MLSCGPLYTSEWSCSVLSEFLECPNSQSSHITLFPDWVKQGTKCFRELFRQISFLISAFCITIPCTCWRPVGQYCHEGFTKLFLVSLYGHSYSFVFLFLHYQRWVFSRRWACVLLEFTFMFFCILIFWWIFFFKCNFVANQAFCF